MLKRAFCSIFLLGILFVCQKASRAQAGDWFRVQSDDGEFSVEVPQKYRFFYNEDGTVASYGNSALPLKKMEMLNAYDNGTLVSIERYFASKDALALVYERDRSISRSNLKGFKDDSQSRQDGTKYRQLTYSTDTFYVIRQYFYFKDHVYVLTTASRAEQTPEMRQFLDSVQIKPDPSVAATKFSQLKKTEIQVEDLSNAHGAQAGDPNARLQIKKPDPDEKPIVVVKKDPPGYTDAARARGIQGVVVLRLNFDENGFIPKVGLVRTLEGGLTRQALMAAVRMKFLPAEKSSTAIDVTRSLEYTFSIY